MTLAEPPSKGDGSLNYQNDYIVISEKIIENILTQIKKEEIPDDPPEKVIIKKRKADSNSAELNSSTEKID